jgi:signal transduction histidine kinase
MDLRIKEEDIPEALKIVIYRITDEALTNVAKHSDAQLIRISLQNKDNGSELTIQDNGEGFRPEGVELDAMESKSHQGLSNMRERTELSGGLFRIESEKKHGTTIRIFWPRLTAKNGLQELSSI